MDEVFAFITVIVTVVYIALWSFGVVGQEEIQTHKKVIIHLPSWIEVIDNKKGE